MPGAPPGPGERAVAAVPSLRSLVDQHALRDRAELLGDLGRPERVDVTLRRRPVWSPRAEGPVQTSAGPSAAPSVRGAAGVPCGRAPAGPRRRQPHSPTVAAALSSKSPPRRM